MYVCVCVCVCMYTTANEMQQKPNNKNQETARYRKKPTLQQLHSAKRTAKKNR